MEIKTIRHSLAHILASVVQEFFEGVKFGTGPDIVNLRLISQREKNGFYYDFALPFKALAKEGLSLTDLPKIEKRMKKLIKQNIKFKKKIVTKEKAKKIFKGQLYKLELIKEIKDKKVTVYESEKFTDYVGEKFIDLCKGPHVKSSKEINPDAFKLTKIAGAYWKGDEKNPMLTRIYGVAFKTKKELDKYFKFKEEAEKRDHRVLGKKLELFLFDEEVGAGLPIWLPNGAILRHIIENYLYEELTKQDYKWLYTPHIGKINLWEKSGHWNFYRENMYSPIQIDEEKYLLKPMNCPFHVKAYNFKIRSYRDLPIKFAELGTVYRYEKSGVLHGLTRVRGFTQDDAHIICEPGQISQELDKLIKHGLKILGDFGFKNYTIYLSTRPKKYAGTLKDWKKAIDSLEYALKKNKLKYQTDPGGGIFYGPKIDIKIKDSLGREWQCTTIQFDFNLPKRFKMAYIDKKGKKQEPYMIHRAILGSIERFIGVLLEHYAGSLPLWLSPVQIWIIPVGARHEKYAKELKKELGSLRVEVKDDNETVSKKIREGEIQKTPYMLIVGDKEMKTKSVRVRERGEGDIGIVKLDKFIKKIKIEVEAKK